ncbi:hypothetical protein NQZ68_029514 [Dissostichus eleginoides]|nr:hypothetical protein NQZ68_029514 [Dissostichus eleginoides]
MILIKLLSLKVLCTVDRRELTMAGYRTMMALLLTVGIVFQLSESRVTCRNDRGKRWTGWYILYKLPLGDGSRGLSYLYMDESTNGWKLSKKNIDSSSGTLGNTLKPLLDFYVRQTEGFGYVLYNDQLEKKTAPSSYGHSKGVVMLDKDTGVWLSHSTPKFPKYRSESFWPKSGHVNGQTFLCVTYSYGTFKQIGLQLKYIHPYAYDHFIPKTFHMELQNVAQMTGYPTEAPAGFHDAKIRKTFVFFSLYNEIALQNTHVFMMIFILALL